MPPRAAAPARRERPAIPGLHRDTPLTVDDLAQSARQVVQAAFDGLWVAGEVTQFTQHRNGHWYFTLKGERSTLRCVMWQSNTMRVPAPPDEGMHVVVLGALDVFVGRTELQFAVRAIEAQGEGLWRKAFEQVRQRLDADGLLSPERKRPLPFLPRTVAIITSADGAALHDILTVAKSRNPMVRLVLVPAVVQGDEAPRSLRLALDRVARWGEADVVIIGRGGGSRDDLWCFNDERLARAVAACPVPVVSAVGHEVDVSICDLVADFRAPTPSAAAERVVPRLDDLRRLTARLGQQLAGGLHGKVGDARRQLERTARRAMLGATGLIERRRLRLQGAAGKLHVLSPLATLARGYAMVTHPDGSVISSITQLSAGEAVQVKLADGNFDATVRNATPDVEAKAGDA